MGREPGIAVGYDPGGEAKPRVHMLIIHLGDLGACDCQLTWQKDGAAGAPMIHYHQYAVEALALGKACDEIHGDLCERGCVFRDCDFVEGGMRLVCQVLVLLANSAPLHVLFHPGPRSRPVVVAVDLPDRLVPSPVPSPLVFVPYP